MSKRLSLIAFFAFFALCLCAQQVTEYRARQIASMFYGNGVKFNLAYIGGSKSAPDYYVFNLVDNKGYVMVAGDENAPDIIPMYSDEGSFDGNNLDVNFKNMLDGYAKSINAIKNSSLKASSNTKAVKETKITPKAAISTVGYLLGDIAWHQESPYYNNCPLFNGKRSKTGCGATATGQVFKYWNWPPNGAGGSKSAYDANGSVIGTVDYTKATYDWSLIPENTWTSTTDSQNAELAKVNFHIGVAIDMKYGTDGSGTNVRYIPGPLTQFFSYSDKSKVAYRLAYTDAQWLSMIKKEINNNRAIIYSGDGSAGGHLFVCDGYDSSGKIHLNFGWNGSYNGFYALSAIGPGGLSFPSNNTAMIGIFPNNVPVEDVDLPAPQIALLSSINSTKYSIALNETFNIGIRVSNYDTRAFNSNIGVALYKGEVMQGSPLGELSVSLIPSSPAVRYSDGVKEYDFNINDVKIPSGTPDGTYTLRTVAKQDEAWYTMQHLVQDVTKEMNVVIKDGVASLTYPFVTTNAMLELTKPIDVSAAANVAKIRFSVRNISERLDCDSLDLFVMANPNTGVLPTVWTKVHIDHLQKGMTQDFEVTNIPIPPGTNVTSCRFYVAYSRVNRTPTKSYKNREVSADPMQPLNYNFSNYNIPQEEVITNYIFRSKLGTVSTIPNDWKRYNVKGEYDASGSRVWIDYSQKDNKGNLIERYTALGSTVGAKLVTSAIDVRDENYVLEWKMYGTDANGLHHYLLYISTDGQDFSNFTTPVFDKSLDVSNDSKDVARVSLAKYAGKKIYIAFESTFYGIGGIAYYKLLNIRTPKEIVLNSINIPGTVIINEKVKVKASVKNGSAANVKEIKASYTINNVKHEEVITTDIPFSETREIEFKKPAIFNGDAGASVPITVTVEVDGEESLENNTLTKGALLSIFSPRKKALTYKTTKLNCGGCKEAYSTLDIVEELYPGYSTGLELWRDGNFMAKNDFPICGYGSTPSFYINTVWQSKQDFCETENLPNAVLAMAPPADIVAVASYESEDSRLLNITLKANFAMPAKGNYKMGAIIVENNVKNIDGEIAGTDHPAFGSDQLTKNHIPIGVIAVNDAPSGSIIANPEAKEYSFNCSFTVPDPDKLDYKYRKDNIIVVAVLYGPKGEILNCSQSSYYVKLRKTDGLTFIPVDGYPSLKQVYDIESNDNKYSYKSVTNNRATVVAGNTYKFRISKDASWDGFKPKLLLNKNAMANRANPKYLTPDENGVYTLTDIHQNHLIEFEKEPSSNIRSFSIVYQDQVLNDGDEIDVDTWVYSALPKPKYVMTFAPKVQNTSDYTFAMNMVKEVLTQEPAERTNTICWDQCMEPSDITAESAQILPWETQYPYGEMSMYPIRLGTTTVKYTFSTLYQDGPTLGVTVNYVNSILSGIEDITTEELSIKVINNTLEINSAIDQDVKVFDIAGRLIRNLKLSKGVNIINDLLKGTYIINKTKIIL